MKITIEFDSKTEPCAVGEYLREQFFNQREGLGCYETFTLNSGVLPLPKQPVPSWASGELDDPILGYDADMGEFTRAELNGVIMEHYWDGDGFLAFILDDGSYLVNSDCKKRYRWESYESKEIYWSFKV
jgi:hypothetical protein